MKLNEIEIILAPFNDRYLHYSIDYLLKSIKQCYGSHDCGVTFIKVQNAKPSQYLPNLLPVYWGVKLTKRES